MRSPLVYFLVQTLPVVISLVGVAPLSANAVDIADSLTIELNKKSSTVKRSSVADIHEQSKEVKNLFASGWDSSQTELEWDASEGMTSLNGFDANVSSNARDLQTPSGELELAQVEQTPVLDGSESSAIAQTSPLSETIDVQEVAPRWRFSLTPYVFVPFLIDGRVGIGDVTVDFTQEREDVAETIESNLNFAAAARVEAWRGHLGLIFDGAYVNLGTDNSASIAVPNCLCNIFPSEIETEVTTEYGQFDLGVGYRFAENASTAATEFELGPITFDAIAGIRIYAISATIDINTNVGTDRTLDASKTIVAPLLSGQFRWNVSPNFAGWLKTDLAGLGIGGTLMAFSVTGGIDWMFSGNTSLLVAYRFSNLNYSTDVGGRDFELDVLFHGPYVGVTFRF